MSTLFNKAAVLGGVFLLAQSLLAQNPADNPFDSLDLTGPNFKGLLVKKTPSWPWWTAGIAAGTGTVIYLVTRDNGEDKPSISAQNDAITLTCGGTGSLNVLSNDSGEGISLQGFSQPAGATITHAGAGNLQFSNIGISNFSFSYTIVDRVGQTATAMVNVTVQLPVFLLQADQFNTPYGQVLNGNVLTNDVGSGLSIVGFTQPGSGTLTAGTGGAFSFLPDACTSASFQYTARDVCQQTETGTVTITVTPPALALSDDNLSGVAGQDITGNVLANDVGAVLKITGFSTPSSGTLQLNDDGSFLFSPAGCASESFQYTVEDACGQVASANVQLEYSDEEPPIITCPQDLTIACDETPDPTLTGFATGSDNCGSITLDFTNDPAGLTGCNNTGLLLRTWTATDQVGNTASCQQSITLVDNTPPVWSPCPPAITVSCGQQLDLNLTGIGMLLDDCGGSFQGVFTDDSGGLIGCEGFILRSWSGADACGNAAIACTQPINIVPAPCAYEPEFDVIPANCGSSDGLVSVAVTPPGNYTFLWENGSTEPVQLNLSGGAYLVTISDVVNFCTEIFSVTVPEIPPVYIDNSSTQPAFCGDIGDIILDLNASGGSTYQIDVAGPVNVTIPGIPPGTISIAGFAPIEAGTYTITVEAPGGCAETLIIEVPYIPPFLLSVLNITNPSCPGCSDGSVQLQVENVAILPLQVFVNDILLGVVNSHIFNITNMPVGTFTFHVIDNNGSGCSSNPVTISMVFQEQREGPKTNPFLFTGPVPSGSPVLAGLLPNTVQPYLPEHPKPDPLFSQFIFLKTGPQIGLSLPAGPNRECLLQTSQYSGEWFTGFAGDIDLRTPFSGFRQEASLRQYLPANGRVQSYAVLGGGWERLEAQYSLLRDNNGHWQTLDTPVRQDYFNSFIGTGIRIRLNEHLQFELDNRLNWQPAAGANRWMPLIRTGIQARFQ